jgi:hypothetical protein
MVFSQQVEGPHVNRGPSVGKSRGIFEEKAGAPEALAAAMQMYLNGEVRR